ncbi:MAG: lysylphosphatidylglycerol synthase transmembrane domain-containing protein [Bacilli bacterium]|nr:lysylphosphatidylglycerol synthase transmembrane domain-containing protein [Bacilli bacterium]
MKKIIIILTKTVTAVCLLVYLFSLIQWAIFLDAINSANIFYILISAFMAYVGIYISILKWSVFLKNYGIVISKLKLYSVYLMSSFFNNFLPTTVGGDFYRIISLNKKIPGKKKEIISSIILERGFGFLSLFLINFLLTPFYYKFLLNKSFLLIQALILIGFTLIIILIFKYNLLIRLKNRLIKKEFAILNKFHNLILSISNIKNKKTLVYGFLNSIVFCLIIAAARYILFLTFNIQVDFFYILLVSSITQIIGILPISLNSIGVTEGLSVFLFSLVGVPVEISLVVALVGRVSLIVTSSLGGLFYFFDNKIKS